MASVLLLSLIGAVFALLGDAEHASNAVHIPSPTPASFSLAPPEFLLRLSLFPDQQKKRNLIGVMVENHETARLYQAGLEDALFIEEFHVEGMISRFLAVFDAKDLPLMVGPVRSLRPYFVDASQPWVAVIVHAGGSPEAFEHAVALPNLTTVNVLQFDDEEHTLRRDDVPAPHNLFLTKESLEAFVSPEGVAPLKTLWPPYPTGGPQPGGSGATLIRIDYFSAYHNVEYRLLQDGAYLRINGGMKSALQPRNVLILEMPITEIGELGRLTIPVKGEGNLLLFRSGSMYRGRWHKKSVEDSWEFFGPYGESLRFAGGATWMTSVPDLGRVEWE
ncbi:hypothetical protein A3G69_00145 [Candidatus Peribacteria bacterium RIFCSPLOWO2_12_FULL_53_10]|nr:MAG: hypothetical protein A3G69_00145 [Candidatus Peribacteria bacterium RIFCSPLOWO2_12_FULL_53_10]